MKLSRTFAEARSLMAKYLSPRSNPNDLGRKAVAKTKRSPNLRHDIFGTSSIIDSIYLAHPASQEERAQNNVSITIASSRRKGASVDGAEIGG